MGEKEDKEKAEKLAAAKKRVAQLQKKKKAAAAVSSENVDSAEKASREEPSTSAVNDAPTQPAGEAHDVPKGAPADDDEAAFEEAIKAASTESARESTPVHSPPGTSPPPESETLSSGKTRASHVGRQPSLSFQSKIRSTSFRRSSTADDAALPPLSPEGDTIPDIYRKQALRLEELEKENKRLAKEVSEGEVRWRKSEEELEELREGSIETQALKIQAQKAVESESEIVKLRAEVAALTRQRRSSKADDLSTGSEAQTLRHELERQESTIADMELEISRLRSQVSSQTDGCETHGAQIAALQQNLRIIEKKLKQSESELADTKKALGRATEKAVLEGTERTSKDTKIRSLEREMTDAIATRDEIVRKAESLEKKIEAMNKLHREAEGRNAARMSTLEKESREAAVLKARLAKVESDHARLREERERRIKKDASGADGADDLDELEDQEREKLQNRIRELEAEVFDLKRGVWRDRRQELQPGLDEGGEEGEFDEIDLAGSGSKRRSSFANALLGGIQPPQQKHSNLGQIFTSGLAAFRAATTSPDQTQQQNRPRNDSLLHELDDDDDDAFDEQAFAQAQREEEARKMVEHVREVKRKLTDWQGWRLDLVDVRRGAGVGVAGFGEIFEV